MQSKQSVPTELVQIFNTALIKSRVEATKDFSADLFKMVESPAFAAILKAIQTLANEEGIPEGEAAVQIIATFRKMDGLWGDYLMREGAGSMFCNPVQ